MCSPKWGRLPTCGGLPTRLRVFCAWPQVLIPIRGGPPYTLRAVPAVTFRECVEKRKSGRGLGDRGECARCRNGDLQARRVNPEATLQVALEFVGGTKESLSNGPLGLVVAAVIFLALVPPTASAQDQPPAANPVTVPTAPVLENTGKPMVLPFQCTAEELRFAGLSCTEEEPCPLYLELTAVESAGDRILAAGNVHSTAVTLSSVLLATDDAGHSWREVHQHILGAGLDRLQFLDAETGWASGQVLFPLQQDPFLLVTSDGGKSWRQRAIFTESRENRFGSIQQFSFTAKDNGSLIVDRGRASDGDRYELYESPDAGESCTIKETSAKPLALKRPPVASPDWRVRADGPTASFHIEHRQGQRWTSVSGFSVKLAACKLTQ